MTPPTTLKIALAAGLSLAAPHAGAQSLPAMSEAETMAVALYAMPTAFRSLQARCTGQLPGDAYMFARGGALSARLERAARGQFPAARAAVTRMAAANNPGMATLLEQLPAENIEPLVAELIAGKVQSEVKVENCGQIDRVLELLDPLPPENLAALLGVILREAQASQSVTTPPSSGARR